MTALHGSPMRTRASMLISVLALLVASRAAPAQTTDTASPVGVWQTIDDHTHEAKALVEISALSDGTLIGKLLRGLGPDNNPQSRCTACTDARKDQLMQGMVIITGLKRNGNEYEDGEILDPENGKLYKCKVWLENQGRDLVVRGYIGVSLIGRSQTWHRDTVVR